MGVAIQTYGDRRCPTQQVYAVVVGLGWRKITRLGEDVGVLVKQGGELGMLQIGVKRVKSWRAIEVQGSEATPEDALALLIEGHAQVDDVLEDRTKGVEEVNAENEVETTHLMLKL